MINPSGPASNPAFGPSDTYQVGGSFNSGTGRRHGPLRRLKP
jgi:hypothetical protein